MAADRQAPSILGFQHRPEWGPAAHRKALAGHLRRCRDHAGIAPRQAARCIHTSEATISRMETGRIAFKQAEVEQLLDAYRVSDPLERARIADLVQEAAKPEVWQPYANAAPPALRPLLAMEPAARRIISYEPQLVPGWLQTEEYAEIVIRAAHPTKPARDIAERVALRMQRVEMLRRAETPPVLLAVMDSEVFRRQVGTPGVMYRQIKHLLALLEELPYQLHLQIAPLSVGAAGAIGHPVVHLRFFTPEYLPDLVYLEQYEGAVYREKPSESERYQAILNNLCGVANPAEQTPALLEQALASWR
ncbi:MULTISPECIES: helix-turn-helix domain-containing protein [Streptomyces]|uniref:helix-turn-helix domain-containing protein n=1 Tax=Streptomyces TaxID=1883 RepID=UPI001E4D5BB3|nr:MULTISPECIES: helix-turn-helix transcriptional regulator [Streptomyces]UFQ13552.1 helix-turn-helix domain-containing protein [Streptomyces huasconensis]UFQ19982.1 helix-turn-helix domain-containing protein [Streptomyces huasconensis]WCL89607.1 helix-turn-helix transcriptional regulator [Streptomyces sp. JCM 35825]